MKLLILTASLILATGSAFGSDLGYGRTQSSSSVSNRFKATYNINAKHKVSFSYRSSYNTSGIEDPNSSTLKWAYRYRTDGGSTYAFEAKKSDELYFFDSTALAARFAWPLTSSTRITVAGEVGEKSYSLNRAEKISQRTFTAGIDQEILSFITIGVEMSSSQFRSNSSEASKALSGATIPTTNIASYADFLYDNSSTLFLEMNFDSFTLGASYSSDSALLTSSQIKTTELYADISIYEVWSLGLFLSRGKVDGSTSTSDTSGLSVNYRF